MEHIISRHVIDLEDIGQIYYNFLFQVFREYSDSENIIRFVYTELLAQLLLSITNDKQETDLRLIGLPEMQLFEHLPILSDHHVFEQLVRIIRHTGERLFIMVNENCNRMGSNCSYYFESATLTYLVLTKQLT